LDSVIVAIPPLKVAEPTFVVPFLNVTLPVGTSGPGDETVAVKMTVCP
jgi:hypothetical protein